MDKNLALKILDAILISSRRKIKLSTLKNFFVGLNLNELINELNQRYSDFGFFVYRDKDSIELVSRPELANYLINFFGYEEMHVLPKIFIQSFGPISFVFLKAFVVFSILIVIEKLKGEKKVKEFIKLIIGAVGASTGIRDLLRILLLV